VKFICHITWDWSDFNFMYIQVSFAKFVAYLNTGLQYPPEDFIVFDARHGCVLLAIIAVWYHAFSYTGKIRTGDTGGAQRWWKPSQVFFMISSSIPITRTHTLDIAPTNETFGPSIVFGFTTWICLCRKTTKKSLMAPHRKTTILTYLEDRLGKNSAWNLQRSAFLPWQYAIPPPLLGFQNTYVRPL
jgi:hypothetical protein